MRKRGDAVCYCKISVTLQSRFHAVSQIFGEVSLGIAFTVLVICVQERWRQNIEMPRRAGEVLRDRKSCLPRPG